MIIPEDWLVDFKEKWEEERQRVSERVSEKWLDGHIIDREYCLDHWSNHKDQLALVALYPEEFAYLLVLQRKCMAIQERIVIAERILPKGGNDNYASLTGDMLAFSFFRTGASYWSVTFDRWYSHTFVTTKEAGRDFRKGAMIAKATGDFALTGALEMALQKFAHLWENWGTGSIEVREGIIGSKDALKELQALDEGHVPLQQDREAIINVFHSFFLEKKNAKPRFEMSQVGVRLRRNAARKPKLSQANKKLAISGLHEKGRTTVRRYVDNFMKFTRASQPKGLRSHIFTFCTVVILVARAVLITLAVSSISSTPLLGKGSSDGNMYSGLSQAVLSILSAICAVRPFTGRQIGNKAVQPGLWHLRICLFGGAICAVPSAYLAGGSPRASLWLSYATSLLQAISTIVISSDIIDVEKDEEIA